MARKPHAPTWANIPHYKMNIVCKLYWVWFWSSAILTLGIILTE